MLSGVTPLGAVGAFRLRVTLRRTAVALAEAVIRTAFVSHEWRLNETCAASNPTRRCEIEASVAASVSSYESSTAITSRPGQLCGEPWMSDIVVRYRKSVMNNTRSAVTTAIAELPSKFVRYRTFASDVTTSASSACAAIPVRTVWSRRSRMSVGACDMDGGQPLLEGCKRLNRTRLFQIRLSRRVLCGWQRRGERVHGWRRATLGSGYEARDGRDDRRTRWWRLRRRLHHRIGRVAGRRRHMRNRQLLLHLIERQPVGSLCPVCSVSWCVRSRSLTVSSRSG